MKHYQKFGMMGNARDTQVKDKCLKICLSSSRLVFLELDENTSPGQVNHLF